MNIFGLHEDPVEEFLPTAITSTESDSSRNTVWFSSFGKSIQLFLVLFKPYIDLNVKILLRPSACEVITVQPCFHINTSEKRIKNFNISIKSINFAEDVMSKDDSLADKYYRYYYEKACQTGRKKGLRLNYQHTMHYIYQISLQQSSCLAFQILPEYSNFKAYTMNRLLPIRRRRIKTLCNHFFIVTNPKEMIFSGYYINNFAETDESEINILSSSGAVFKGHDKISFDMSGERAMVNFNLDMDYFSSPSALVAQNTEQIASGEFKLPMVKLKEQWLQSMVLLWSILSVNIPKITNDINQCKKIDVKVLPSTHPSNKREACTDAFVMLRFYRGKYIINSATSESDLDAFVMLKFYRGPYIIDSATSESYLDWGFIDFTCKEYDEDALVVWYKIKCNEPRPMSFVVDSKVSYRAGDRNIIFPRNVEFEIIHATNNKKDIYVESSSFITMKINDTTECIDPIINLAENGKTRNITFEGRQYFLFTGHDLLKFLKDFSFLFDDDDWHGQISWNMAAIYCESLGLHLLTIGDVEEERAVLSLLSQKSPGRSDIAVSVFLGLISQRQVYSIFRLMVRRAV